MYLWKVRLYDEDDENWDLNPNLTVFMATNMFQNYYSFYLRASKFESIIIILAY